MLNDAIRKILGGENLSVEEARSSMEQIMSGQATPASIAAYLVGLRMKGETSDEIFGSASVMVKKAVKIRHSQTRLFDNCGTGGDGAGTFNISTTSAFVIAAAGLPVGKHGNRSVSSKCGSADILEALGARLDLTPEQVGRCIDQIGFGFMFAPALHPAMKEVMPVRRELGVRTIFNMLGPLTNPAGATHQLIGVFDRSYLTKLAEAASQLGLTRVCVVHNEIGIDEITTAGDNHLVLADQTSLREIVIKPEDFGFRRCTIKDLAGGEATDNIELTRAILNGAPGPGRDTVVLNTAVALFVGELAIDVAEGVQLATNAIDSGKATRLLDSFIEFTNGQANA